MLSLSTVSFSYGGVQAVSRFSMSVKRGTITSLIGPNGAGKTTTFNLICGELHPQEGEIFFNGVRIDRLPSHRIASLGISRTFQNIRLFPSLTVKEHISVSQFLEYRSSLIESVFGTRSYRREVREVTNRTGEILRKVGLDSYAEEPAANLPYGLQRRVEFARALAVGAVLILLDEPTAGMNIQESNEMMHLIQSLTDSGMTILLVEHDMRVVMSISNTICVMDHGTIIATGNPAEIRNDPQVIKAYLGESVAA